MDVQLGFVLARRLLAGEKVLRILLELSEENLQRFQHHTKHFWAGLLIVRYRNTCSNWSKMCLKGFGFPENVDQACASSAIRTVPKISGRSFAAARFVSAAPSLLIDPAN
jgi:hypothetical protein